MCRCREIELWTFTGLVGAFLDLGITYFLLCASTLAYLVSKFLALFGKCLPCPCNGQFGDPYRNKCWQKTLVKCPSDKISSVQFSALSSFPFDSVLNSNFSFGSNEMEHDNEGVPLEAETSCSLSKEKNTEFGVGKTGGCARDLKDSSLDPRILTQRRRGGARNLRFSSVASQDRLQSYVQTLHHTPITTSKMTNDVLDHAGEAAMDAIFPSVVLCGSESTETVDGNNSKNALPAGDLTGGEGVSSLYTDEKDTIRVLQQELEGEYAASTALRIELEKERGASASAADEAMAMILRLQEEKASVEMEARQFKRMIEEKSAFDFEEMNILKEILVRREKEKHFLEKEVEAYREMIFGNEQLDSDARDIGSNDNKRSSSVYSQENQALMPPKISGYFNEVENENTFDAAEAGPIESVNHSLAFGKALPIADTDEVNSFKQDCFYRNPSINEHLQYLSSGIEVTNNSGKKEMIPMNRRSFDQAPYSFGDSEKHENDSVSEEFSESPSIHDVHVVDEKPSVCGEVIGVGSKKPSLDAVDIPTTFNRLEKQQGTIRSCSGMASWLPSTGYPRSKSLLSELRRNSMSAVDYERFKIDSEVGWLRERLRMIQEGREKLNISLDHNTVRQRQQQQLGDIWQLTEPGEDVCQDSLPLKSCKVMSRRRCSRSVSLGIHKSS